jgi:hypothetical protein
LGEAVEEVAGIVAESGVDRGGLDDGAARGAEPVEALALGKVGDGAGVWVTVADAENRVEVLADEIDVSVGPERGEAAGIEMHARLEEFLLEAEDDNGGVDELLAFDARDDAEDDVIK